MRTAALVGLSLLAPAALRAAEPFYLHNGDRVVFYGDSITEQRLYTTFVESFVLTRFPGLNAAFVTSGWPGDCVTGGQGGTISVRLERDVLAYRPTVVAVLLGMNDTGYQPFNKGLFDQFARGYERLVHVLKAGAPGARLTLLLPSPFDDVTRAPRFPGGVNAVVRRYGAFIEQLARREGATTADLNTPVVAAITRALASAPKRAERFIPDRVHPGAPGHLLMAAALLKAWHAPATVSDVAIDLTGGQPAIAAEHAAVSAVRTGTRGLSWVAREDALPFPLDLADPGIALAAEVSDIVDTLDRERLRVRGLEPGAYALWIDGQRAGTYRHGELASGINLATADTPMRAQALDVHQLTLRHNDVHFARWRDVQVALPRAPRPAVERAMRALDAVEDQIIRIQHQRNQPRPHRFELVRE